MGQNQKYQPAAGRLLIADPSLEGGEFRKSIVLLADHSEEGSMGVIINNQTDIPLSTAVKGFKDFDMDLFFGGPVETDTIFFLHTLGSEIPGTIPVGHGLFWGGESGFVRDLINHGLVKPDQIRFFLGYSGWAPGQLQEELDRDSWIVYNTSIVDILSPSPEEMWPAAMKAMGRNYAIWSTLPFDPEMN